MKKHFKFFKVIFDYNNVRYEITGDANEVKSELRVLLESLKRVENFKYKKAVLCILSEHIKKIKKRLNDKQDCPNKIFEVKNKFRIQTEVYLLVNEKSKREINKKENLL